MSKTRAVALNCIDGRAQVPVISWIKENYDVDYVDMITEPGIDGLLANSHYVIDDIVKKLEISVETNKAWPVFVVGHHDCKGNPVDDDIHKENIKDGTERLKEEFKSLEVIGLWVNSEWSVDRV